MWVRYAVPDAARAAPREPADKTPLPHRNGVGARHQYFVSVAEASCWLTPSGGAKRLDRPAVDDGRCRYQPAISRNDAGHVHRALTRARGDRLIGLALVGTVGAAWILTAPTSSTVATLHAVAI